MTQELPQPPEGMVSLSMLMEEIDPSGSRCMALTKRIDRLVENKHPLVALAALVSALVMHIEDAPKELRGMLGKQTGEQLSAYFRKYMQ